MTKMKSSTIPTSPILRYKLISMELKTGAFNIFEDEISKWIEQGWECMGGIDVKTISVSGWFLTQAMVKE